MDLIIFIYFNFNRAIAENLPIGGPEVISLLHLFPLLVEIGSNSSCTQLRNESLNVMRSMVKMADKVEHLEPILRLTY
jgi:hypothetical protein